MDPLITMIKAVNRDRYHIITAANIINNNVQQLITYIVKPRTWILSMVNTSYNVVACRETSTRQKELKLRLQVKQYNSTVNCAS